MARRKANEAEGPLSHPIIFRVTEQEYKRLEDIQKKSDCHSIGEVIRRTLIGRHVKLFHKDASLDGVIEELAGVLEELRAIGVNINQITRHFNASTKSQKRVFLAHQALEQYQEGRAEGEPAAHAHLPAGQEMVARIITGKSLKDVLHYNEHKVDRTAGDTG